MIGKVYLRLLLFLQCLLLLLFSGCLSCSSFCHCLSFLPFFSEQVVNRKSLNSFLFLQCDVSSSSSSALFLDHHFVFVYLFRRFFSEQVVNRKSISFNLFLSTQCLLLLLFSCCLSCSSFCHCLSFPTSGFFSERVVNRKSLSLNPFLFLQHYVSSSSSSSSALLFSFLGHHFVIVIFSHMFLFLGNLLIASLTIGFFLCTVLVHV